MPTRNKVLFYTVSRKCTNFETVLLRIVVIDFDDIWQKYSKVSRTEFVCFSFHVGLLSLSTFLSNQTPKITPILMLYARANINKVIFF